MRWMNGMLLFGIGNEMQYINHRVHRVILTEGTELFKGNNKMKLSEHFALKLL